MPLDNVGSSDPTFATGDGRRRSTRLGRRSNRIAPDPRYQVQALDDIASTLAENDRATAVMACGAGKTLVALWTAERQSARVILVLLPSLSLLSQTLKTWKRENVWGSRFSYICVCSDETVDAGTDDPSMDEGSIDFPIDTDPAEVRKFLRSRIDDVKVVFSTYHSASIVGEAAAKLKAFDLGVFDEAHRTAGAAGRSFGFALSDRNIRIRKRLFMTATPRHVDIRHRDRDGDFCSRSMDDEEIYGPRAYTLSFAKAVRLGIISRYKVIVSMIDKKMVSDFARKHGITLVKGDAIAATKIANLIAMRQAIGAVDARKIITFHGRVQRAKDFASDRDDGIARYLDGFEVHHVNGKQASGERGGIIRSFAEADRSLITNARCLTEGVDVPAVDMVAFIDPKQSRIDIAQAVGRAMRKPRGPTRKICGYVVIPLFAGMDGDDLEDAIKDGRFDAIAEVVNALQEHDEELVEIIKGIRERKGAGESSYGGELGDTIEAIGPFVDLDKLAASIAVEVADRIGSGWDEWYGRLKSFAERAGHCSVPRDYREGGFNLSRWVAYQRHAAKKLSPDKRAKLDSIGFSWNVRADEFDKGYSVLVAYHAREGHTRVPSRHMESGFRLGSWVASRRKHCDRMSTTQRASLDAIGFIWDPFAEDFMHGLNQLVAFKARTGHCRVQDGYKSEGFDLGTWVGTQRRNRDTLSTDRKAKLDDIGFIWDPFAEDFMRGLNQLAAFKARTGHCRVHPKHKEDGFNLGAWVGTQRRNRDTVTVDRKAKLDAIGFIWDPLVEDFMCGLAALTAFRARNGHCRLPAGHKEGEFNLANWVNNLRARNRRNNLPADRKAMLDGIGFIWDPLTDTLIRGLALLKAFQSTNGHCRVPFSYKVDEFNLGTWVWKLRKRRDLSPDFKEALDKIGFYENMTYAAGVSANTSKVMAS